MDTYTATIRHHSISRAREITISGSLHAAKIAATREFGDGFLDHDIVISDEHGVIVARRRIGDRRWRDTFFAYTGVRHAYRAAKGGRS